MIETGSDVKMKVTFDLFVIFFSNRESSVVIGKRHRRVWELVVSRCEMKCSIGL